MDVSPRLISAAVRLNSYFAQPCVFAVHDLNNELVNVEGADTVFCFSLVHHIKRTDGLVLTIVKKTKHVVYFEGHAGTTRSHYDYLLNNDYFSAIELIGYLRDGIHTRRETRPFFRCEISK